MKKLFLTFLLLNFVILCSAQLTINIVSVPTNTPVSEPLYLAGTINNWNTGDDDFQFSSSGNGQYTITINPDPGEIKFKITRGAWSSVEGNANGGFRPNREYTYSGGNTSLDIYIEGWEDLGGSGSGNSTATNNVLLLDDDFFIPQLNRNRKIWIYLPEDYDTTTKTYPVFYAQDGQNLFDLYLSFSGEWEIDESLNTLFDAGDNGAIVVGIANGGAERINEYSPWVHPQYGGGQGDEYAAFIVETLKPYVDANYRTKPEREFTGVLGSSMGGLISLYTAIEYQEVFGKAGIFSPSLCFSDEVYSFVSNTGKEEDMRIYLLAGEQEDNGSVVAANQAMYNTLINAGFGANELNIHTDADGQHSEWYWAREFPFAYEWLCAEVTSTESVIEMDQIVLIYPNPTRELLRIRMMIDLTPNMRCELTNMNGQVLINTPILDSEMLIDTAYLETGVYMLRVFDGAQVVASEQVVASRR